MSRVNPLLPKVVCPVLATAGDPPTAEGWAVEFKWDGVRAVVAAAGERVRISSRTGNDVTAGYPEITAAALGVGRSVLLDGELIALDERGRPDFGLLQQRMHLRAPRSGDTRPHAHRSHLARHHRSSPPPGPGRSPISPRCRPVTAGTTVLVGNRHGRTVKADIADPDSFRRTWSESCAPRRPTSGTSRARTGSATTRAACQPPMRNGAGRDHCG